MAAPGRPPVAVLGVRYPIETSALLKAVVRYVQGKGHPVVIVVDRLERDSTFSLPGARLVALLPPWWHRARRLARWVRPPRLQQWCLWRMKDLEDAVMSVTSRSLRGRYAACFCGESESLRMATYLRMSPKARVFISMEATAVMRERPLAQIRQLVHGATVVTAASEDRAQILRDYLHEPALRVELLPVSLSPSPGKRQGRERQPGEVRFVYSGYFADWACVRELAEAFLEASAVRPWSLTLHGHHIGTEGYFEAVSRLVASAANVHVDTTYYDDDAHLDFLADFDIGLAVYKAPGDDPNWSTLEGSSGKVATYAWAGLAVAGNVDPAGTYAPPFLDLRRLDAQSLTAVADAYLADPDGYRAAAGELAARSFDATAALDRIWGLLRVPG